jgi:pimeloyl-ACP methyl ester carboxylesterase
MNSLLEPAISPDIMGVFAREPLEDQLVDFLDSNIDLRISFGDHDWMRTNEPSARKVVAALGKSRARLDIVPNAGHHLYLENNDEFVRTILT